MDNRRVVITGIGAVTPLGNNIETTWEAVKSGKSGVGPLTRLDADLYSAKVAAEAEGFSMEDYVEKKDARKMDRFTHYALAASIMAMKDADLELDDNTALRTGVWIGSGIGGMETIENQMNVLNTRGVRRISPFLIPMIIPDMASGQVSIYFGAKAINSCSVTACASGTNSIGDAFKVIQRGDADVMISGGAEAPITQLSVAGFTANTALTTKPDAATASRPFDKNRDGFVIG